MVGCLTCQSSSSAHYSVKALASYQLVCESYGQTWKQINLPTTSSTTTTTTTTTTVAPTTTSDSTTSTATNPSGDLSSSNSSNNGLSSGAIAGIVVSVIALIVALSVAGYVWGRRRRDAGLHGRDVEEYKYRGTPDSYMEVALPQYTGMIQPSLPSLSKVSNLRVMNPDSDDDAVSNYGPPQPRHQDEPSSFEVQRNSSPGWRRGSFDDD
ncbi:hypothetical protein BGZ58_004835 [Dissophora ornata]|nr:hypothetical protein BGZ58_004835 [Dissophora ornata]